MAEFLDDRAFLSGLHEAFTDFQQIGKEDAHQRAEAIADSARSHVHVLSGQTRDAIGVEQMEDGWEVGTDPAKVDNEKALSEEFGTSDQSPRPFMRPAIEEHAR